MARVWLAGLGLLFILCAARPFAAAPAFLSKMDANVDNANTFITSNGGTISGSDKYIVCALVINSITISGTSVVINDTSETLTKQLTVDQDSGGGSVLRTEIWDKVNPADSTGTTTVTGNRTTGAAGVAIGCAVYTGVNQATPFGGLTSSHTSAVSDSVNVTTGTDELVVYLVGVRSSSQITEGAGQTLRVERIGTNFGNSTVAISDKSGSSPLTMSSSSDDASAKSWATVGLSLKPVGGGGGGGGAKRGLLTTGVGRP